MCIRDRSSIEYSVCTWRWTKSELTVPPPCAHNSRHAAVFWAAGGRRRRGALSGPQVDHPSPALRQPSRRLSGVARVVEHALNARAQVPTPFSLEMVSRALWVRFDHLWRLVRYQAGLRAGYEVASVNGAQGEALGTAGGNVEDERRMPQRPVQGRLNVERGTFDGA